MKLVDEGLWDQGLTGVRFLQFVEEDGGRRGEFPGGRILKGRRHWWFTGPSIPRHVGHG
ncbi:unnamed protein product [Urochloa humidicola]